MEHQRSLSLPWSRSGDKGCRSVQRGCLSGEDRGKLEESGYSVLEGRSWAQRGRGAWGWRWKSTRSDPKGTLFGRSREWSKANSKGGRVARVGQDHGEGTHSPRRPLEPTKRNSSFQAICESEGAALQAPRASRPPPPTSPQHNRDPPHSRSSVRDSAAWVGGGRSRSRNPERTSLRRVGIGFWGHPFSLRPINIGLGRSMLGVVVLKRFALLQTFAQFRTQL